MSRVVVAKKRLQEEKEFIYQITVAQKKSLCRNITEVQNTSYMNPKTQTQRVSVTALKAMSNK